MKWLRRLLGKGSGSYRCPTCRAYSESGKEPLAHSPTCPRQTLLQAKAQLEVYYEQWLKLRAQKDKWDSIWMKELVLFKGKYFQVKLENNALRKRNAILTRALKASQNLGPKP